MAKEGLVYVEGAEFGFRGSLWIWTAQGNIAGLERSEVVCCDDVHRTRGGEEGYSLGNIVE
jgi:hypothetical protein